MDNNKVIEIIETAAATEIMPWFQRLTGDDIREKSPGDPVTIADLNSERYLSKHLTELVPGSLVVGEEGADADPETLEYIHGTAPVWILDPVDGTGNFSRGETPFVVIVAYVEGGVTKAGWIHDPVAGQTVWAEAGKGAWCGPDRLTLPAPPPLSDMTGSLSHRVAQRLSGEAANIRRVNCVGRDYMDLALGELHYARYAFRLKPWDHAAGVLIHAEAGGYSRLVKSECDYTPALSAEESMKADEILFAAPNEASWKALTEMLADR